MRKSRSEHMQAKRTGLGYRTLRSSGIVQNTINQHLERTALGNACFELGRTHQNFIEKRFGRTVPGCIENFGRLGFRDAKHLGRVNTNSLAIKFGRTSTGFRKIEFGRQVMGSPSYETGRVIGGFRKINLSRQTAGNINYDMGRTLHGGVKQFGRVVPGFVRGFGRVTPSSIQCGRVVAGFIQFNTQADTYRQEG
jgi:hypothetical protein